MHSSSITNAQPPATSKIATGINHYRQGSLGERNARDENLMIGGGHGYVECVDNGAQKEVTAERSWTVDLNQSTIVAGI